jgi:hypothetical protein
MSGIARLMQMGAAGAGNHPAPTPIGIEDYFSTYLYTGNGSTQTITNGIDLAGEGGLVWTKPRSAATLGDHILVDSERGNFQIQTNTTSANNGLASFNFSSSGYVVPNNLRVNESSQTYASWTFRKAPRFFDVVTWSGTANQTIQHSLGVEPGCIIVKRVGASEDWWVFHRSVATDLNLNLTSAALGYSVISSVTSTTFNVNLNTTSSPDGYVAYLFAHDPLGPSGDGSDGLIACGGFTTDGSGAATVNLGWEPQWILAKRSDNVQDWKIIDTMRGFAIPASSDAPLFPNSSAAEGAGSDWGAPTATGFIADSQASSANFIYIAIRRGPMRAPTSGTEVFHALTRSGNNTVTEVTGVGFPVDMIMANSREGGYYPGWTYDRLRGEPYLLTPSTGAEVFGASTSVTLAGYMDGYLLPDSNPNRSVATAGYVDYAFRRAPEFFDAVAYSGTGTSQNLGHSLGVAPETVIVKNRSSAANWSVYHKDLPSSGILRLNQDVANLAGDGPFIFGDDSTLIAPTDSVFTVGGADGTSNTSGQTYIAYLFATLAGVSKVGSYTGNGTSQTIDCGFTSGARFILIKRTDSTGDWYVWDTARGIVTGNDPHLSLNTTAAEVTTDDSIDPEATGFIVNQLAATNINVSSASYIFYAVA